MNKSTYVGNSRPTEDAVPYQPLEVTIPNATARGMSDELYKDLFYRALGAFRAKVQKEKVLSHYKMAHVYESPSEYKRRKRNEAMRKNFDFTQVRKVKEKEPKQEKEITSDYDLFD